MVKCLTVSLWFFELFKIWLVRFTQVCNAVQCKVACLLPVCVFRCCSIQQMMSNLISLGADAFSHQFNAISVVNLCVPFLCGELTYFRQLLVCVCVAHTLCAQYYSTRLVYYYSSMTIVIVQYHSGTTTRTNSTTFAERTIRSLQN